MEQRQATLTERIASRQPVFVVVTILIVVLAGASHVEKLVLLFSTRGVQTRGLGERIRVALDRYRAYPVRYFSLVALTLALLVMAGSLYVYLEADKRASERTLGLLQFCHLALREAEAKSVLDEQRRNLDALQSTAGSIRMLVDKLPPYEQRNARDIVEHIDTAISKQGRFVGDYLEKSGQSMKTLEDRTLALERELLTVQAGVGALKGVPADVRDASAALKQVDAKLGAFDGKVVALDGKVAALDGKLGAFDGKFGALDGKLAALDGSSPRSTGGSRPQLRRKSRCSVGSTSGWRRSAAGRSAADEGRARRGPAGEGRARRGPAGEGRARDASEGRAAQSLLRAAAGGLATELGARRHRIVGCTQSPRHRVTGRAVGERVELLIDDALHLLRVDVEPLHHLRRGPREYSRVAALRVERLERSQALHRRCAVSRRVDIEACDQRRQHEQAADDPGGPRRMVRGADVLRVYVARDRCCCHGASAGRVLLGHGSLRACLDPNDAPDCADLSQSTRHGTAQPCLNAANCLVASVEVRKVGRRASIGASARR